MRLFRALRFSLLALLLSLAPASSFAGVFISINFGPPVLPVYEQPPCPQPDLIWTPGYWAYGPDGYYWVPGAWVPAPFAGGLWTPGYWGWNNGLYVYNPGYWGYHVGYYGGVNYGGGYLGIGFAGGEWRGGHFAYNTAVVNVNTTIIHTTYINRTIIETNTVVNNNHVAYSGGPGGVQHQPTAQEQIAAHETHTPPTTFQSQHETSARSAPASYAKNNGGHPATLAVAKPLAVETHAAPAAAHNAIGSQTSGAGAGKVTSEAGTPETRTAAPTRNPTPPAHNTEPARTNAPPARTNTAPKSNPKPAEKPKPEGHEKQ